jgi:hypothetical protein
MSASLISDINGDGLSTKTILSQETSGAIGRVAPTGEVTQIPVPLFSSTRAMIELKIAVGRGGEAAAY